MNKYQFKSETMMSALDEHEINDENFKDACEHFAGTHCFSSSEVQLMHELTDKYFGFDDYYEAWRFFLDLTNLLLMKK